MACIIQYGMTTSLRLRKAQVKSRGKREGNRAVQYHEVRSGLQTTEKVSHEPRLGWYLLRSTTYVSTKSYWLHMSRSHVP